MGPGEFYKPQGEVIEFERAVLGTAMEGRDWCDQVLAELEAEDFADPFHCRVYRAIMFERYGDGVVNYVTVYSRMITEPVDRGLPFEAVARLSDRVLPSHLDYFIDRIQQASRRRKVLVMLQESMNELGERDVDLIARVQNMSGEALALISKSHPIETVGDGLVDTLKRMEMGGPRQFIPTGLASLDNLAGGYFPGQMWVLAGRTSMGKTALAQTLFLNLGRAGRAATYFSIEGNNAELRQRLISIESGIGLSRVLRRDFELEDARLITEASERISKMTLYPLEAEFIWRKIRARIQVAKIRDPKLSVVFVDHLQVIKEPGYRTKWDAVDEITRDFKTLCLSLNITGVLVCQINRETEKRKKHIPSNADLRDSGSVEQNADNILLLYRPHYYDKSKDPTEAQVCISKQRNGPTGSFQLTFDPASMRFSD